jgi:hypothetical protein
MGPLCPISIHGSPVALLKLQMVPRLILLLMSSGSKKQQPRYACLSEAKASHSQRVWAEVSSSAPHLLHNGLSDSPIRWRCLLTVLCPVRRPVAALDCVLLGQKPSLGTNFTLRIGQIHDPESSIGYTNLSQQAYKITLHCSCGSLPVISVDFQAG